MISRFVAVGLATILIGMTGCGPGISEHVEGALDRAAVDLDQQLTPAGQLAATAALIAENTGQFPTTQFELLGSREAAATGALQLNLSALDVNAYPDRLELDYILLPTRQDPTDRMGRLVITPADGEGQYEARVALDRRADPDHEDRRIALTEEDQVAVRRLEGRFCIDLDVVEGQVATGAAGDLPLAGTSYTVTFTPSPGFTRAVPRDLRDGYTVRVGT